MNSFTRIPTLLLILFIVTLPMAAVAQSDDALKQAATKAAELLGGEKFAAVRAMFNKDVADHVPEATLQQWWNGIKGEAGAFRKVTMTQVTHQGGVNSVTVSVDCEKTLVLDIFAFDQDLKISGISFRVMKQGDRTF
jgi:hypothetical protein